METNNLTNVKSVSVSAVSNITSSGKAEGSQNTVFENLKGKNVKNLSEREIKYLQSKGYDVSVMTDKDIQEALIPLYTQNPESAPETQTPAAGTPSPATPVSPAETQVTEAPQEAVSIAEIAVSTPVQTLAAEAKHSEAVQQPEAQAETSKPRISPTEVKVDYKSEAMRTMMIAPEDIGCSACEFYTKLSPEEQSQAFVNVLAKKTFGEQWETMSDAEKAQAVETVEADLAKNIPVWRRMTAEDKGKLALAFFAASDDVETKDLRFGTDWEDYDKNSEKPLNEQIKDVSRQIVVARINTIKAQEEAFDKEIRDTYGDSKEAQKNLYANQFAYLESKKASGKELNAFEKRRLEIFQNAKKMTGDKWQNVFGDLNTNRKTSTFAQMRRNGHFKKLFEERKNLYYQQTNNMSESEARAVNDARKDWIIHQFEGIDKNDKPALIEKFKELRDNCHTPEEQFELSELCKELVDQHIAVCDDKGAKSEAVRVHMTDENGNINEDEISQFNEDLAIAHKEGRVSGDAVGDIAYGSGQIVAQKASIEFVTKTAHNYANICPEGAEAQNELTKEGVYSTEQQEAIYKGALDKVSNKESLNVLARGIGYTDDSIECGISKAYNQSAVEKKDAELMEALGEGISHYSKDNQTVVLKDLISASCSFDEKTAISLQKGFADQVQYCHKDNQLAMHSEFMNSKYNEVQIHAAENIKNYDNSVKSAAIDVVYKSGNMEALQKVYEIVPSLPPSIQKAEIVRAIAEAVLSGELTSANTETKILSGTLSIQELSQMTPQERREYFIKRFEEASPAQKLSMMKSFVGSSMIDATHKKLIYTMIARSSYLKDMVESGMGLPMLKAGLPVDAVNKIINAMKVSTSNTVIEQRKELATDPSFKTYFKDYASVSAVSANETEYENSQKYATPMFADFMKESFTPVFIDAKTRAELMKNKSTMYIKS